MEINRRAFVAGLGGASALALMTNEQKANALENHMEEQLNEAVAKKYPTMSDLQEQQADLSRPARRGAGKLFQQGPSGKLLELAKMPDKPTLLDFYEKRFAPANHVLQSATRALKEGMPEEIILACLLHDVVLGTGKLTETIADELLDRRRQRVCLA